MKVRCTRLASAATGEDQVESALRVGSLYSVLEIEFGPSERILLRILDDDANTPGVWPVSMFEFVSSAVPPNWYLQANSDGTMRVAPRAWLREGFWERFFDRDPAAEAEYRLELPGLTS